MRVRLRFLERSYRWGETIIDVEEGLSREELEDIADELDGIEIYWENPEILECGLEEMEELN